METNPLALLLPVQGLNQSDLARLAGVSRQAVSLWMRGDAPAGMRVSHLLSLSRALGVGIAELAEPLPGFEPELERDLEAEFLWDGLYSGLLEFAAALARRDHKALARLAQVYGLYRASKAAGGAAWTDYPEYRRHIKPARREGLDRIWRLETSRA